jgi:lipopolysaccharide export LptBFGC system permease protein LptF
MKRLDRYVLSVFLPAALLFSVGMMALAMLVDFVMQGDKFFRLKDESVGTFALQYYGLRLPLFLRAMLPAIPLFAAAFTVIRLARTNELVPMCAVGLSLRRLFVSFLIFAGLCGGALVALEEWVMPPLMPEVVEMEATLGSRERAHSVLLSDWEGTTLFAPAYDHLHQTMLGGGHRGILLVRLARPGQRQFVVRCERAVWSGRTGRPGWTFTDGVIQPYEDGVRPEATAAPGRRPEAREEPLPPEGLFVQTDLSPIMVRRWTAQLARRYVGFREARQAIREDPDVPELRTRLTDKFTHPISPVLLLALGLPFVSGLQQTSQIRGNFLCLLVSVAYFTIYLIGHDFANRGILPVSVGCWGPTLLFGCLGAAHYGMIKT